MALHLGNDWSRETRALHAALTARIDPAHAAMLDLLLERVAREAQDAALATWAADLQSVLDHMPACLADRVAEVGLHVAQDGCRGSGAGCVWRARAA